jgi:hypothetical protein
MLVGELSTSSGLHVVSLIHLHVCTLLYLYNTSSLSSFQLMIDEPDSATLFKIQNLRGSLSIPYVIYLKKFSSAP